MLKLLPEPHSSLWPFDIVGKRFFGSRPKAFKDVPSASKPDKRHGSFFFSTRCILLFCFTRHRSHKARDLVSELKTPFRCRLFVLFLCHSSVHFSPPPAGLVSAVWRMPLSHRALPPLRSQGTEGLLLLFEEAGRKVWSHTPKRRKAPALGEEGYHLVNEALCDFFFSSSEFSHEKKCWKLTLMYLGSWVDVQVA